MYPLVLLRKLRPDGAVRMSWYCYRLPDRDGFVRLFVPSGTPRVHVGGSWSPAGVSIAALDPARAYVVHWWEGDGGRGFYVDTARSIRIDEQRVSYVDLFLDLSFRDGGWTVLDEHELALAPPDDAMTARSAQREVERLIERADPLFDFDHALWVVPADARTLRPRTADLL